ncbi:xanthine dehydrogenase family protein subunit M, partial [Azospirillum brasilense]|nr:xanthine dehydrogenase family protein subunit M [Azospirillum brasilense]
PGLPFSPVTRPPPTWTPPPNSTGRAEGSAPGIAVRTTARGRNSPQRRVRDRNPLRVAWGPAGVGWGRAGDRVRQAHVALGGVATVPWRARPAEALLRGETLDRERALEAARAAFAEARAGRHNAFKIELGVRTLADAIITAGSKSQ